MHFLRTLLTFTLVGSLRPCLGYDYCHKKSKLCKHFVCDLEQVPQKSDLVGLYPMTSKLIRQILHLHNDLRSRVARGGVKIGGLVYPEADHMPELIWDNELEYAASEHAKRCHLKHDKCRQVPAYLFAGQNLATQANSRLEMTAMECINVSMAKFELESEILVDATRIDQWKSQKKTGHFTAIINDQQTRVGCGVAKCQNCNTKHGILKHCNHLSCNYDFTNVAGLRIYVRKGGPHPGSSLKCVPLKDYPGLCKNDGKLRPKVLIQKLVGGDPGPAEPESPGDDEE